jgi:hypothetical protein
LYEAGDAYSKMGPRYRQKAAEMFQRIVREYPTGERVKKAKDRLAEMEMPVPEVDKAALDRANYNKANYKRPSLISRSINMMLSSRPDTSHASKIGDPTMTAPKATIPASVPVVVEAAAPTEGGLAGDNSTSTGTGNNQVSIQQITGPSKLDTGTDARTATAPTPAAKPVAPTPLPTNRDAEIARIRAEQAKRAKKMAAKRKKKNQNQTTGQPAAASTTQSSQPAAAPVNGQPPGATGLPAPATAPASTPPQQ